MILRIELLNPELGAPFFGSSQGLGWEVRPGWGALGSLAEPRRSELGRKPSPQGTVGVDVCVRPHAVLLYYVAEEPCMYGVIKEYVLNDIGTPDML